MNKNEWKVKVKRGNKTYIIENNSIDVFKKTLGENYGNGFGTIYELHGKKTVYIYEYNTTWACRGMGMNDRRFTKLVSQELYDKIKGIIEEIKAISNKQVDENTKFEEYTEVLENIDVDTFYDYM